MHALIIEDDALTAFLLQDLLESFGYTSFDFASGEDAAVRAARRKRPDLVTADVRLAQGTGVDAVDRITAARPVPTVFVTASPEQIEARRDAIVVRKPVDEAHIRSAVERAVTKARTSPRLRAAPRARAGTAG